MRERRDGQAAGPDFHDLFGSSDEGRSGLTSRTTALLYDVLRYLGELGRARISALGARPACASDDDLFTALPVFTWSQGAHWRHRFVAGFDRIADRLGQGRIPLPSTPAEEFALWIALLQARLLTELQADLVERTVGRYPAQPGDFDWPRCHARLLRHAYLPLLLRPEFEGLEDPSHPANRDLGIGDYRPEHWFAALDAV